MKKQIKSATVSQTDYSINLTDTEVNNLVEDLIIDALDDVLDSWGAWNAQSFIGDTVDENLSMYTLQDALSEDSKRRVQKLMGQVVKDLEDSI